MPIDLNKAELYSENFHVIIGFLEDMLVDDDFINAQNIFMEKYWHHFDKNEENKLICIDIFKEYQEYIENFIENYLQRTIENFNMNDFLKELLIQKADLNGEIFEVLFTFTDFLNFKEMILDYRAMKEGQMLDLGKHLSVSKIY